MPGPVRRLLVGHALASVAMSLPWPLLLVLVWQRAQGTAHADLLVGLTGAARMLPYVALSWATGALADRFRRDRLLRVTLVVRAGLLLLVAAAVTQGWLLAAVLAASMAVAAGTPAYPALAAALPRAAGADRRRATDLLVTIEVASFVVGPALGGLLLALPVPGLLPALGAALTLLALGVVRGLALPRPVASAPGRDPAVGPVQALRGSAPAARAVAVAGLLNAVGAALLLALLPVAHQLWSEGERGYGLATGALGFGALAAPLLWRVGRTPASRARWGLLLLAAGLGVVPLTSAVGWAVLPLLLAGAATVHVEGALTETIQVAVPDRSRAGVLGLTDSVMVGAALAGSLLAPWLGTSLGPRVLLAGLTAAAVSGAAAVGRVGPGVGGVGVGVGVGGGARIPQQRRPEAAPPRRSAQRAGTDSAG